MPQINNESQKISTCNQLDLEPLESEPIMSKNPPRLCWEMPSELI